MKPVLKMTLWTRPGAWRHPGAEEMWSLSTLLARALVDEGHFSGLELHTDARGAEWVNALGLPYTAVDAKLDALIPAGLETVFAAGKLAAYTQANGPFIHLDGDVMLRRQLPQHALAADFLFERPQDFHFEAAHVEGWRLPEIWQTAVRRHDRLMWHCGVAGGRCWQEVGAAASTALNVLATNAANIANGSFASMFAEQWGLARELDAWRVATLLPGGEELANEAAADNYWHFCGAGKMDPRIRRRINSALARLWTAQVAVCASVAGAFTPDAGQPAAPELS